MKPSLALPIAVSLALFAALANSACCCLCHPAPQCPDANLPRDDSLTMTVEGSASFVARAVNGADRRFCQMNLAGSCPVSTTAGDTFVVESIEFFGTPGEHSAEETVRSGCCGFFTLPWPSREWNAPALESSWDGSTAYTLAARVVYVHRASAGVSHRVYTLARGRFLNIVQAARTTGAPPIALTDGATITSLTVGGVFQSSKHTARYDVSVSYTSSSPATLVEVFTKEVGGAGNGVRIWQDPRPPRGSYWSATQIPGPFAPPMNPEVVIVVTYANGAQDHASRYFANPVSSAPETPLQ